MLLSLPALALAAALRLPAPPAPATLYGHLAHAPRPSEGTAAVAAIEQALAQ